MNVMEYDDRQNVYHFGYIWSIHFQTIRFTILRNNHEDGLEMRKMS
jgi:hypothetical protein